MLSRSRLLAVFPLALLPACDSDSASPEDIAPEPGSYGYTFSYFPLDRSLPGKVSISGTLTLSEVSQRRVVGIVDGRRVFRHAESGIEEVTQEPPIQYTGGWYDADGYHLVVIQEVDRLFTLRRTGSGVSCVGHIRRGAVRGPATCFVSR
jgi:hypothetical protein